MATLKPISVNLFEAILLSHMLLRPAIIPLKQADAIWYDTLYSLAQSKRGAVQRQIPTEGSSFIIWRATGNQQIGAGLLIG